MGKTHNDSNFGSRSESYKANKDKDFAKIKSSNLHHSINNENRNADEISFVNEPANKDKVKKGLYPDQYKGLMGNIDNKKTCKINEILPNSKNISMKEQIETEISNIDCKQTKEYLIMCKKQLERRHKIAFEKSSQNFKMALFNGHKKPNKFDMNVSLFSDY